MRSRYNLVFGCILLVMMTTFILAADPTWNQSFYNVSHYFDEDTEAYYNFTAALEDYSQLAYISILGLSWSENTSLTSHSNFPWLMWNDAGFSNSSTGNMRVNTTFNNETGNFTLNVHAQGTVTGQSAYFEFIINATNDAPNFTNFEPEYNLTIGQAFSEYINATDEEQHYPLSFNISFYSNCTHFLWSGRSPGENCTLFNFGFTLTNVSNTSALMSFTPTLNDVGVYWANFSVTDYGENYTCPHVYCDNSSYEQNKTTVSTVFVFNVLGNLTVNVSDCQNQVFQENQSSTCQINITTKGESDEINVSTTASVRNYAASVANSSWFYANNLTNASNFVTTLYINVTPQKTEIGNWSINISVADLTYNQSSIATIYIYVNRTFNDVPDLVEVSNLNTSMDLPTRINLTVYDDDLLIPDKREGYNETSNFTVKIYNQSALSQELSLNSFDVEILSMPVAGTNRTEAKIEFTPTLSEVGNYTINITINDEDGTIDYSIFNLSIVLNNFPSWNQTNYTFDLTVNSTFGNTPIFSPINLSNGYVTDPDVGDVLTYANSTNAFPGFNLSSTGMVSFTPWKRDVGNWTFSVTVTDNPGLSNTTTFIFNISNINSDPVIEEPILQSKVVNATVDANSNINASEDNYTTIAIWIDDEDYRINKKDYYNETLSFNLTIQGPNPALFNFIRDTNFPYGDGSQANLSIYTTAFTPNKTDVGFYNITINVSDASNASDVLTFNLNVLEIEHSPVLVNISNQSSAVNRSFYYDINTTDTEDIDDASGNLTYNITFLQGTDFVNGNESIFNTTSGIFNFTFNDSHDGKYEINITVNDSAGRQDREIFWIYVYGTPNITYPNSTEVFNAQENVAVNLTFRANHTIQDNLTYAFYLDGVYKYNVSSYGNDTNMTWQFTPNFTDESFGQYKNLTLVVYPANTGLVNRSDINYSMNWSINITHSNAPVNFTGYMGDVGPVSYGADVTIDLKEYFSDPDYNDTYNNQTVNFTVISNSSNSSAISWSVSADWVLTLSASSVLTEVLTINATDLNSTDNSSLTSAVSNSFEVEFIAPVVVPDPTPTPSTGGGTGSTGKIVSLKIIMPDPVSAYFGERIVLPVIIQNDGEEELKGINLSSLVAKNNQIRNDIRVTLSESYIKSLKEGEQKNITMIVDINTEENGTYEIIINASVKDPKFNDWGILYLHVKEGEGIREKLLFTQEFLQENPECIEIEEILDEAEEYFKAGDFVNTVKKIDEAIEGCKNAISQQARLKRKEPKEDNFYRYLLIATIVVFFLGVIFHSYKRIKLSRSLKESIASPETKPITTAAVFLVILTSIFIIMDKTTTGAVVGSVRGKFGLSLIFILGVFGFLIFLKRVMIFEYIKIKFVKRTKDSLESLLKKKVYTGDGDYIGFVEEIKLGENKVDSLRIKLARRSKGNKKIKAKGIVVKYKDVDGVGDVVIVDKKVGRKIK
ncbi:MAG: Ig domain-containing protein [archaeon]